MNYSMHYDRLIDRARSRVLFEYFEKHHVLPRCMGGGDNIENIVQLTAEEHYVAHQLLVKIYPGIRGLVTATVLMAKQCTGNKAYGWLRRRHAIEIGNMFRGKKQTPEQIAKAVAAVAIVRRTLEYRQKMAIIKRGNKSALGHKQTPETRARISAAKRGKPHSSGYKLPPRTAEHRAKIGVSSRGRIPTPEARAKMSVARMGNKNAVGNKIWIGRKHSLETKLKISAAARQRFAARNGILSIPDK